MLLQVTNYVYCKFHPNRTNILAKFHIYNIIGVGFSFFIILNVSINFIRQY